MNGSCTVADLLSAASITFTNECSPALNLTDITADSRQTKAGGVFCAFPGLNSDGREYIGQAVERDAALILCESKGFKPVGDIETPIILVDGLQGKLGLLADTFFARPSSKLQVFGVTGTNGKTTCCYLLAQAFAHKGLKSAIMGTLGYGPIHALQPTSHTTPDAISVHRRLAELCDAGITQVCMEVSSHALDQGRVVGVHFYATLFTNLSHDHLDYHGDMQAYGLAKQKLFTRFQSELAVVNADDALGAELIDLSNAAFVASYGEVGDVAAEDVIPSSNGLRMHIEAGGLGFEIQSPLVGVVNLPNLLLLVTTLLALSTPVEEIQAITGQLRPAPGRMELISRDGRPSVVIDYAHTPDALEKALRSVRQHCDGQLWCVFGCGGDRDREKRPLMGAIASANADRLVVTNDNPRTEAPAEIADQIVEGIDAQVEIILDRAQAIASVIKAASADDWVMIAGKGHEATQTIGSQIDHFSDQEQVLKALEVAA